MKLIGVVDWTHRDKNGIPIAGVVPLVEKQKDEWRSIDAKDEFPSQGQVFWFAAHAAVEKALVQFRAKPNPGQKDDYQVDAPELIWEVLDLRRFGSPADVRATLIGGAARIPGPMGAVRALVLCASDVLVGPVDLTRAYRQHTDAGWLQSPSGAVVLPRQHSHAFDQRPRAATRSCR